MKDLILFSGCMPTDSSVSPELVVWGKTKNKTCFRHKICTNMSNCYQILLKLCLTILDKIELMKLLRHMCRNYTLHILPCQPLCFCLGTKNGLVTIYLVTIIY